MMAELSFSDGFKFMQGRLRIVKEHDDFYVVGEGMFLPVKSYEEGLELIRECEEKLGGKHDKDEEKS